MLYEIDGHFLISLHFLILFYFVLFCLILFYYIQAHEGKALCVDWMSGSSSGSEKETEGGMRMVSGGSDCLLHSSHLGEQKAE